MQIMNKNCYLNSYFLLKKRQIFGIHFESHMAIAQTSYKTEIYFSHLCIKQCFNVLFARYHSIKNTESE